MDKKTSFDSGTFNFAEDVDNDTNVENITISLTFYLAFSAAENTDQDNEVVQKDEAGGSSSTYESKNISSSQSSEPELPNIYTKCEYKLEPFNKEVTRMELWVDCESTRIQVSGNAKTIKNWCSDSLVWVTWTNNHTVTTSENYLEILSKEIDIMLTVINSDKMTIKLKVEKPKSSEDSENEKNVKSKMEQLFEDIKDLYGKHAKQEQDEELLLRKKVACSLEVHDTRNKLKDKILNELLSSPDKITEKKKEDKPLQKRGKTTAGAKKTHVEVEKTSPDNVKSLSNIEEKQETFVARINFVKFVMNSPKGSKNQFLLREFLPRDTLTSLRLQKAYVRLDISKGCLLSEEQLCSLNPMRISIKSAKELPSQPLCFFHLRMVCEPSYVTHCFLGDEKFRHKSHSMPQNMRIIWDDHFVIFLGQMEPSKLKEYFFGPGLKIEVHDRDLKKAERSLMFGCNKHDTFSNDTSYVSYQNFLKRNYSWSNNSPSCYGEAIFNLSDILLGQTYIKGSLNITNSSIPYDVKKRVNVCGNYITSGSLLNVEIALHHPFVSQNVLACKMKFHNSEKNPFIRMIIRFCHCNTEFLRGLIDLITKLNTSALGISHLNFLDQQVFLATYKLSREQSCDPCFDVITGFHVCDKLIHLVVLEGLVLGELTRSVYHLIQFQGAAKNDADIKVMHHTNMTYQDRLYSGLNLNLQTIRLQDSICEILSQPIIHTRGLLTRPCYKCLVKLYQIQQCCSIADVARSDSFPLFEEISELVKELAVGICHQHLEMFREEVKSQSNCSE